MHFYLAQPTVYTCNHFLLFSGFFLLLFLCIFAQERTQNKIFVFSRYLLECLKDFELFIGFAFLIFQ